jgi:hypothetical protein
MEWLKNTKDFLLIDGRVLAAKIREKPENEQNLCEKSYLWFHDNFEMIIIIGGLVLLALLIYTYLDEKWCSVARGGNKSSRHSLISNRQTGGQGETPSSNSSSNTPTTPTSVGKTKDELRAEAMKEATERASTTAREKAAKKNKGQTPEGNTDNPSGQPSSSTTEDKPHTNQKISIKSSIKNKLGAASGKASAALQSIKSGEALELGKEKFADAIANSKEFARQHAKAGYALAFTVFMVAGFGLFFVPTLIMFIIGGITLAIFNKQKMVFLANT